MRLLAVLLLLVPLAACTDDERRATTAPRPTASPATSVPTPPATPTLPPGSPLDDLPAGVAPKLGYVVGTTYVAATGERTRLHGRPGVPVLAVAPLGNRLLVLRGEEYGTDNHLDLMRHGRFVRSWNVGGPPVVGRQGEVAWSERTDPEARRRVAPVLWLATGGRLLRQPLPDYGGADGVLDGEVVYSQSGVFGNEASMVRISDLAGTVRDLRYTSVYDVDERHGRAIAPVGAASIVVIDLAGLHQLWTAPPRAELQRFSPSGRLVLASYGRSTRYAVLAGTTGHVRSRFRLPDDVRVVQVTWETDRALLFVVRQHRGTTVLRADLDGTLEVALPLERDHRSSATGYVLEQRP